MWSVSYSDHSGNVYRFWHAAGEELARFAYKPVKPETSSSGAYSGGEACEGTLAPAQIETLFDWVRAFEADTEHHAESRMMRTGLFRVCEKGCEERRFIIRPGHTLKAFDAFLEPLRTPKRARAE